MGGRLPVLLGAAAAAWEATALRTLSDDGLVVLKRCVDLTDLLATAATGVAELAVVAGDLPGLDADAVAQLARHDVRTVAVGGDAQRLQLLGVTATVTPGEVGDLGSVLRAAMAQDAPVVVPDDARGLTAVGGESSGLPAATTLVAVHGPAGAPGRTTVALALATLRGRADARSVLVDADPHGGAVAQHLGVLDEVSGLLAAARLVNSGSLDAASLARCRRTVHPGTEVLTGLPRPDRWVEVRPGVLEEVVALSADTADVVIDTGFSLEADLDGRALTRNQLTLDAVAIADEVVVVGSAEPTGLVRLARCLVDLRDATPAPVRVVVNRMRDTLGWSRRDITAMVEGYVRPLGVHFLPEDRPATDRALVAGRSVAEGGDSALRRALVEVAAAVFAEQAVAQTPPIRR